MAALQTIRGKAGLLVGILGVALLAFIFGDLFSSGGAILNKFKDNAFSVDGQVITTKEYADRVEARETLERIINNKESLSELERGQIKDAVFEQVTKEMILDKEAEKLGLAVTTKELDDMMYGQNISPILYRIPFFINQETGQFDRAVLIDFLSQVYNSTDNSNPAQNSQIDNLKKIWLTIEGLIKYQRLEEKYASLVASSSLVNNVDIQSYKADSEKEADINYIVARYATVADSAVNVTDADLKALYDLRKKSFKLNSELRKVSYFIKDVIPSETDYAVVEKEMTEGAQRLKETKDPASIVNDFPGNQFVDAYVPVSALSPVVKSFVESSAVGEVYGPVREGQDYNMFKVVDKTVGADSTSLQLIVFPRELDLKVVSHIADSLYKVIKAGDKFDEIADKYMPGANGGNIGMVDEMNLIASGFPKDVVYGAKGTLVKTTIGGQTCLIKVVDKSKSVSKVKLAHVKMPVIISDKTQMSVDNELAKFINESGNVENFAKGAENYGYSLVDNAQLYPTQLTIDNVSGSRSVVQWAFSEKVGALKKFDLQDKRIIAIITGEIKGDYLPFEESKEILKPEVMMNKKAEKLIADLTAKNISSLEAYANVLDEKVESTKFVDFNTNNISGLGYEPVLNVYSKLGQKENASQPIQGYEGVYVLSMEEQRDSANHLSDEDIKNNLTQNTYYQLIPTASMALYHKMNVKDNRVNFW